MAWFPSSLLRSYDAAGTFWLPGAIGHWSFSVRQQTNNESKNMSPDRLIDWAISVAICIFVLSATGIQDWIAKLLGSKHTRKELEEKIVSLESRIEKLEKTHVA